MTVIKSGDLVVLKSGGPVMTVDTVNTDIFDDNRITGVLCAWFVGERLERVRFDPRALEPALLPAALQQNKDIPAEEATGDYKIILDEMSVAMNIAEAKKDEAKPVIRRSRRRSEAAAAHSNVAAAVDD
jgi:uncharacterized protein YodC (DUF2158 family)